MRAHHFVICIDNANYGAALDLRKVYEATPDDEAVRLGLMRVIDESGDDYLYPVSSFVPIELQHKAERGGVGTELVHLRAALARSCYVEVAAQRRRFISSRSAAATG